MKDMIQNIQVIAPLSFVKADQHAISSNSAAALKIRKVMRIRKVIS